MAMPVRGWEPEEDDALLVLEELALAAEDARANAASFLSFVMREESTLQPITAAPHQRLFFEFVEAHRRCVVMMPVGHSKTFGCASIILQTLGRNPLARIAIVSATGEQAEKTLKVVRGYIEASDELHLVFPELQKTAREGEPWTDSAITVARPHGIKDASLVAVGLDSKKILGSRWDLLILDDILNDENTATPDARAKVLRKVQLDCYSRVEPKTGRIVYVNTARHIEDVVQKTAETWPTLTMRASGAILIRNSPTFDSDEIRAADDKPAADPSAEYRLTAHDYLADGTYAPDNDNAITLWPERLSREEFDALREGPEAILPEYFARNYENLPLSDSASLCKQSYLDRGMEVARTLGVSGFARTRADVRLVDIRNPTQGFAQGLAFAVFTGVDLAVSKASGADNTAIYTFAIFPNAIRVPLWIDFGKWGAEEIIHKVLDHIERYEPMAVAVENVGAQELFRQLLAEHAAKREAAGKRSPIKPFTTDKKKHDPWFGVPALFSEMANGLWAIPNDRGQVRPEVRKWMNECLQYSPQDHTGDTVMASYFASELAKKFGVLSRLPQGPGGAGRGIKVR